MSSWLYLEADLICICILWVVRISLAKRTVKMPDDRFFLGVVDGVLVMLASDAIWAAIDGKLFFAARLLNVLASGIYLFFTAAIALIWLIYIYYRLYEDVAALKKRLPFFSIPAAILLLLCIVSYWTGWVYWVDDLNVYHRGPLHWMQMLIGCNYLVVAAFYTAQGALRGNLRINRQECSLLIAMTLFAACGGLAQAVLFKVPVAMAGVVIALLSVFINIQNKRAAQDELTQISNRGRLRRYITGRISSRTQNGTLYLLLLDLDHFAEFNSQFGRLAGNKMLKIVADVLLDVSNKCDGFVARYGGDEFALVVECNEIGKVERLVKEIQEALAIVSEQEFLSEPLTITASYTAYDPALMSGTDMLCGVAEEQLRIKKDLTRDAQRSWQQ